MEAQQVIGFVMDKEKITRRYVRFEGIESDAGDDEILYLPIKRWHALGRPASIAVEVYVEQDEK